MIGEPRRLWARLLRANFGRSTWLAAGTHSARKGPRLVAAPLVGPRKQAMSPAYGPRRRDQTFLIQEGVVIDK